jgi:hypothetical protein
MIRTSLLTDEEIAWFVYAFPVSGGKGDETAEGTENSESGFSNALQQIFNANNASQQNQLNFLNSKMQSAISNPQGYSPSTLAAMRAQANDQVAANTQNEEREANTMADRGGAGLPSGVAAQTDAAIAENAEQQGSNAQQNITEANANLQNENEWNAIKADEGVAGMENPEGDAGDANSAAGTVGNLSGAVTASSGPTAGSILGSTIGAAGTAFGGGSLGKIFPGSQTQSTPIPPSSGNGGAQWGQ